MRITFERGRGDQWNSFELKMDVLFKGFLPTTCLIAVKAELLLSTKVVSGTGLLNLLFSSTQIPLV